MSQKLEKLTQRIQDIQAFLQTDYPLPDSIAPQLSTLEAIAQRSQTAHLTLSLYGTDAALLQACQTSLQDHDSIATAYQMDCSVVAPSSDPPAPDCDVLCLVASPSAPLSPAMLRLGDCPGATKRLLIWCAAPSKNPPPSVPTLEAIALPPDDLKHSDSPLHKTLVALVRRRPGDILAQRLGQHVLACLESLEQDLEAAIATCHEQSQELRSQSIPPESSRSSQIEQQIQGLQIGQGDWLKRMEMCIRQSRAELLDEYNRRSITYHIQQVTSQLQPTIVRRGGAKYIQLQSQTAQSSTEVNMDMMQLCYGYLSQWLLDEWRRIYTLYADGGLSRQVQEIYSLFNHGQPAPGSASDHSPPPLPLGRSFQDLVAPIHCEVYFKEASIGNYIVRQLRNQWMGVMFLMTFVTMIGIGGSNKQTLMAGLFQPILSLREQPIWLFIALAIPLCLICLLLFNSYYVTNTCKVEDEAEKLRKQIRTYYQGLAKHLSEKLVADLMILLQTEQQRLQTMVHHVQIQSRLQLQQQTQQMQTIQQQLEACLSQQKHLEKTRIALQRLKRL